jgi:hypothetical protein
VSGYLAFTLPLLDVLDVDSTAYIDVFPGFYEHIVGGNDIDDGRLDRILSYDPECDWDIVRSLAECDRQESVDTKQELGTAVIVCCWGVRRGVGERGETDCICPTWDGEWGSGRGQSVLVDRDGHWRCSWICSDGASWR